MTDAKARLLQMIAKEPHMAGGGLLKAINKAQKINKAKTAAEAAAMRLYHGSPHVMAPTPESPLGKFDPTKIGTGEGAQMYGRGHYLAQSRDVAKNYRPRSPKYEDKLVKEYKRAEAAKNYPKMEVLEDAMLHNAPDELVSKYSNVDDGYTPEHAKAAADYAKWYEANRPEVGGLYHVDLPQDYLANMLDYDKPINQHPAQIKALLEKAGINTDTSATAGSMIGGQETHLSKHGIPGMSYDDTTGAGTRNFVVFPGSEDMLNIVRRDKEGGAVHMSGGGATHWSMGNPNQFAKDKSSRLYPKKETMNRGVKEVKGVVDAFNRLTDQGVPIKDLVGGLVGAVPLIGPDMRKRMESAKINVPLGFQKSATNPQVATGIEMEPAAVSDILEALKPSDFTGGAGMSSVLGDVGRGYAPNPLDVLDAAGMDITGLGGAGLRAGVKGARKAAGALSDLAKSEAGYKLAQKAMEFAPAAQPMSIVKEPGGNWLGGSVERALQPLRKTGAEERAYMDFVRQQREAGDGYGDWVADKVMKDPSFQKISGIKAANQYLAEKGMNPLQIEPSEQALNKWIDSNLTNYVKKQMATPDDPVRKLAEEGISHMPELDIPNRSVPDSLALLRMNAGQAPLGLGKSDAAKGWETATDYRLNVAPAKEHTEPLTESEIRRGLRSNVDTNPWLTKLDPDTPVFRPEGADSFARGLGFDHIVDVLRQDLDAGRIRPEQLNKISMEQAVRRTYEFDQEMAKKMRETQAKVTEGMPVYKEYPEGYKWIELAPSKMPEGWTAPERYSIVRPSPSAETLAIKDNETGQFITTGLASEADATKHLYNTLNKDSLATALKYEGDTMGHCVGGYCPDVEAGLSRIFSLRDAKGEPHVTIEVEPSGNPYPVSGEDFARLPPEAKAQYREHVMQWRRRNPDVEELTDENVVQALKESGVAPQPDRIIQIKGKQNRAPKEDYLPFVQDFVKGGKWSEIGDIQNTGLIKHESGKYVSKAEMDALSRKHFGQSIGNKPDASESPEQYFRRVSRYDPEQLTDIDKGFIEDWKAGNFPLPEEGMAAGGEVSDAKQRLLDMLAKEPHMARGGLLGKAQKVAKATKAAKVEHPLVFPRAQAKTIEDIRPIAQRMAEQMTGEFVKQNPKVTTNPAGKSRKQFERERSIPLETRNVVPERPAPDVNYEDYMGYGLVGVPGDPTMGGVAKRGSLEQLTQPTVELTRVGDITPDYPVPLFGGPRYGDDEKFWASNLPAAVPVQNTVNELAKLYEAPVLGKYIKMGEGSENFALHNLDALLAIQQPEKLSKAKMAELTKRIQAGSPEYGQFPGFTGFKDPADVLLQAQMDSKLRKHIAETLTKPTITNELGLLNGLDVVAAITHPELRNLETGASGFSVGRMAPGAELVRGQSSHPTYDTDIPGSFLGRSRYPTPYEIAFPDTTAYTRSIAKPGVKEFSMLKMLGPRERIDQQYIDEMKMYEQLMKQYTGKKKGGLARTKKVKRHGNTVPN